LNIWLLSLTTMQGENHPMRLTADENRNIDGFCWTADSRYILFLQDLDGDEFHDRFRLAFNSSYGFISGRLRGEPCVIGISSALTATVAD
jgi:hypothetical protein